MLFAQKINLKKYLILTLLSTVICLYFSKVENDVWGILIVMVFAACSQLALTEAVCLLTNPGTQISEKKKKKKLFLFLMLKLIFLFAGLGFGVHFMGRRVIIPLLNYILQIAALGASLRNLDTES
jgi:hypothetical protein